MSVQAYPLTWPDGWPRTPDHKRKRTAPFKIGADKARRELTEELRRLGAREVVVSTNTATRRDGMPYADASRRIIRDPGVAVYFTLKGRQLSMARDTYERIEDNLRSIGLAVAAIRAVERHGGSHMMERAFSGFAAIAPPTSCWVVLGIKPGSTVDEVRAAWRKKIVTAHPDAGGSTDDTVELNRARDAALREIGA